MRFTSKPSKEVGKKRQRWPRSAAGDARALPPTAPSSVDKATRESGVVAGSGRGAAAPQPSRDVCPVVGIGASAGGLEAFSELLSHLPVDALMAFVFIQHLDPKHPSILTDILSRVTRIPVVEVKHGLRVQPGHVYVMPPNTRMTIVKGVLNLAPRPGDRGPHMPIDHFLRSLAEDQGSRAVAVILSGSASDGALGLKAIKAEGGITFAEAPQSAKYDSMPRSAVASGAVDFVLPPKGIAQELTRIARHPYLSEAAAPPSPAPLGVGFSALDQILQMLLKNSGVDFGQYRQTTIRRRIARRMMVHGVDTLDNYRLYLEGHPSQLQALHNDLLVNVTRFFRDSEAFGILQRSVFPSIIERRQADAPIRFWAPGCATGEEAYSLAIGLLESLGETANLLMLGVSDTVGSLLDFFSVVDKKYRVYAKRPTSMRFDLDVSRLDRGTATTGRVKAARTAGETGGSPLDLTREVDRILLSKYAPVSVLVNEAAEILQC